MEKSVLDMSNLEAIKYMSEGSAGACTVIMQLYEKEKTGGLLALVNLDELGFRADKIWVAFKDYCKQDIDVFIKNCNSQDKDMIGFVRSYYSRFYNE